MSIEIVLGLTLAVGIAGVTATMGNQRHARVLDTSQFRSKMDKLQDQESEHVCVHCGNTVELSNVRLLFGTPDGKIHVICDKDSCIFAHTQGAHSGEHAVAA